MKKFQSLDGYHVYRIKKDHKYFFLANRLNYKQEINHLFNTLDDIRYDSLIFIFGLDTGEYLNQLKKIICKNNKVIIFEPNKKIFLRYSKELDDKIQLVYFDEKVMKIIFAESINYKNINNVYFHSFGQYETIYKKEYDVLIEHLNATLINASSQLSLAKRFKEVFLQNMIANLKILNETTLIQSYYHRNLNVPALVISAGPSLDKNIQEMLLFRDKLKDYFIITGSRTVGTLVKQGIIPDMIVSVDPIDANYDMMKDYLHLDVPLAFYEYSNRFLMKEYKGDKVYIPILLSTTIESLSHLKGIYCGGSVSHSCIDIANMMGCSPIILVGQDFAYTDQKHHAKSASFTFDKELSQFLKLKVKDVFGNDILTSPTLDHFRRRLEEYIDLYQESKRVEFINCSYGAKIKGASFKPLNEILEKEIIRVKKMSFQEEKNVAIDSEVILDEIYQVIDYFLIKADQGIELSSEIISQKQTKSLIEVEEDDIDLQKVLYMLTIINEFENSLKARYLGGYLTEFLYDMKKDTFYMSAKDYNKLTSDLQHQANAFYVYFEKLKEMLHIAKELISKTVIEFYE